MVSRLTFLFNIIILLISYGSRADDGIVLRKRHFKPVENFTDLVSFENLRPVVPSNRLPSCEYPETAPDMKYILQWTPANHIPFLAMGVGREGFIVRNCLYTNCYVSSTAGLLDDITKFDAILFNGPDVKDLQSYMLPHRRSPCQKYVFVSTQPNYDSPVFLPHFDNFFNWTWTYKLDSDLVWGSVVVALDNNTVVGPKPHMNWIEKNKMRPVTKSLEAILQGKNKAVAWFPSKCRTSSKREDRVKDLRWVLKLKYNLTIDVYGECGDFKCPSEDDDDEDCLEVIRDTYFFYLAYEDTLSEDYVTEILPALKYNAVPIVYGGADYSRFLPDGSYLNSRELKVSVLAAIIYETMNNFKKYTEFFKWTNHYTYFSSSEHEDTDEHCKMCELLNNKAKLLKKTVYTNFRKWWSPIQYRAKFTTTTTRKTTTTAAYVPLSKLQRHFHTKPPRKFYRPIQLVEDTVPDEPRTFLGKALDLADKIHNGLGLKKLFPSIKTLIERQR